MAVKTNNMIRLAIVLEISQEILWNEDAIYYNIFYGDFLDQGLRFVMKDHNKEDVCLWCILEMTCTVEWIVYLRDWILNYTNIVIYTANI